MQLLKVDYRLDGGPERYERMLWWDERTVTPEDFKARRFHAGESTERMYAIDYRLHCARQVIQQGTDRQITSFGVVTVEESAA